MRVPREVYRNLLADPAWADRIIFDEHGRAFLDGARPCWLPACKKACDPDDNGLCPVCNGAEEPGQP